MIAEAPSKSVAPATQRFAPALGRFQRRWIFGLLLAGGLMAVWWTGLALLLLGILDFYAGFSDPARYVVRGVIITVGAAGLIWALWRSFTFLRRHAAVAADRALGTGRRDVLSALELQSASTSTGTPLGSWLADRAVDRAERQIRPLRWKASLPVRDISRAARFCLILSAIFGLCALLLPAATSTIARRLLQAEADIPPYSPLHFVLGPQPAEVLYGGTILVTAEIAGGPIAFPVRCLTRDPATGRTEDSPAFQEQVGRFSGKLEKVSSPLEVAFSVGRARSAWLPVAVRLQPRIQDVVLTVEPPAYSGLPRREFTAGAQELRALPGSRITARVSSNRPLGGGVLRMGTDAAKQEIAAEVEDAHRVRFTWLARSAVRLDLEVRDILGTSSETLQIDQKLLPDERPDVILRQPSGDVLATPDSELPIEATASDDLGLSRVVLVRQLRGYRERSQAEAVTSRNRRHDIAAALNLAPFGVVPGQIIELTLEAGDTNPNLLGVSVSEPARVHIISREQYAAMLRAQTTLEDFSGRYLALTEALNEARETLAALDKAAQSGDNAATEEARKKALEAHQKAGQVFGGIAKDFPIFSLDEKLAETSLDAMERLFENARDLEGLSGQGAGAAREMVSGLKERLGAVEKEMQEPVRLGERAASVGKVFEQAGVFQQAIEAQRELVKDYNRILEQIRRGETQAGQALRDLGRRQGDIAESLRKMEKDLGDALKDLPKGFERMEKEGRLFLDAFAESGIPPTMDEGVQAAQKSDGRTAGDRAGEAAARLEALLRKKNGFCAMCRGEGEQPFPWPEDLSQTLQQLMQALIPKFGKGSGEGNESSGGTTGGPGFGGLSDSGFSMRGKLPQLPIYGPTRHRFSSRQAAPELGGGKGGKGSGPGGDGKEVQGSQLSVESKRERTNDAAVMDAVPEAYRDAVKRYFSTPVEPSAPSKP